MERTPKVIRTTSEVDRQYVVEVGGWVPVNRVIVERINTHTISRIRSDRWFRFCFKEVKEEERNQERRIQLVN